MDRPLWQSFLTLLVVAFALRSGADGLASGLGGAEPLALAPYAVQAAAAVATAIAIWWGARRPRCAPARCGDPARRRAAPALGHRGPGRLTAHVAPAA